MKLHNTLQRLLEFEPAGFPFISLYLNTEPNETGQSDFDVFVKKQLSDHADRYERHTPERDSFDRDTRRIGEYLELSPPSAKGVVIFACAGAGDFWDARVFDVSFPANHFFVYDKPYVFPLARLIAQHPVFAVVLADTNAARIYVAKRGNILEQEEIHNVKTNRSEVGGWAQARYQRNVENFHLHHAKEVVEELGTLVRDNRIGQIVLAGDETVIVPLLRAELPKELDEKVVDVLRLNIGTPEHQLLEDAERAIHQNQMLVDKQQIDNLFEQDYDGGFGVTGVVKTLAALSNGQVQELYISEDVEGIKYDVREVSKVLNAYAPGTDGEVPDTRHAPTVAEEIVRRALGTADEIRFIADEKLLKDVGGVGARLRYKIAQGQNV